MIGSRTLAALTSLAFALAAAPPTPARATTPSGASDANAAVVSLGDAAPIVRARTLDRNAPITTADFSGRVLVLNFWATWCPPCRAETPDMIASYRKLAGRDVAFLGIDTTEAASVVKTFVSAKGVPYPVALAGPDAYNGFGVAFIPTTIVVDAKGVVRARWTGELPSARLAEFVADARREKNYVVDTPNERLVERLLDPARYDFTNPENVDRAVADVAAADVFASAHASPRDASVDYARVTTLEGNVLLAAATAALGFAKTPQERTKATRLLVAADGKLNRFADAIGVLDTARRDDPNDATLTLDIARAHYRLHDYAAGIVAAKAYTVAAPDDPDGWDELGLENQRAGNFAAAAPAYERDESLLVARAKAATAPSTREDANAAAADTALDLADVYVALGDPSRAARAFGTANAFGDRLDPAGRYADLVRNVRERTQEGFVAAHMAHGGGRTALSIAKWTGADLPGSIGSTLKYRLIVAKAPNAKVDLRAIGLPAGWIASFCADGLCSPMHVVAALPESGVKTYEFQLIPRGRARSSGNVRVTSADGTTAAL